MHIGRSEPFRNSAKTSSSSEIESGQAAHFHSRFGMEAHTPCDPNSPGERSDPLHTTTLVAPKAAREATPSIHQEKRGELIGELFKAAHLSPEDTKAVIRDIEEFITEKFPMSLHALAKINVSPHAHSLLQGTTHGERIDIYCNIALKLMATEINNYLERVGDSRNQDAEYVSFLDAKFDPADFGSIEALVKGHDGEHSFRKQLHNIHNALSKSRGKQFHTGEKGFGVVLAGVSIPVLAASIFMGVTHGGAVAVGAAVISVLVTFVNMLRPLITRSLTGDHSPLIFNTLNDIYGTDEKAPTALKKLEFAAASLGRSAKQKAVQAQEAFGRMIARDGIGTPSVEVTSREVSTSEDNNSVEHENPLSLLTLEVHTGHLDFSNLQPPIDDSSFSNRAAFHDLPTTPVTGNKERYATGTDHDSSLSSRSLTPL